MASKDTAKTASPQLKEHVLAMAEKIEKGLVIDKKTGVGTESTNLYETCLPEGLDMDQVKRVSEYNTDFVAAGTYAFGKIAVAAMKSSKGLDKATAEIPMGVKDTLSISVERTKEYTAQLGEKKGETIIKHGVTTTAYDVRAGKNGGQLKIARQMISELAMAQLTK